MSEEASGESTPLCVCPGQWEGDPHEECGQCGYTLWPPPAHTDMVFRRDLTVALAQRDTALAELAAARGERDTWRDVAQGNLRAFDAARADLASEPAAPTYPCCEHHDPQLCAEFDPATRPCSHDGCPGRQPEAAVLAGSQPADAAPIDPPPAALTQDHILAALSNTIGHLRELGLHRDAPTVRAFTFLLGELHRGATDREKEGTTDGTE